MTQLAKRRREHWGRRTPRKAEGEMLLCGKYPGARVRKVFGIKVSRPYRLDPIRSCSRVASDRRTALPHKP